MMKFTTLKVDDKEYHQFFNILEQEDMELIVKDINYEILYRMALDVPRYQTKNDMYDVYGKQKHWSNLYDRIFECLKHLNKQVELKASWANIVKGPTNYAIHQHVFDITTVFFLQNKYKEFGTLIKPDKIGRKEFIIPGVQNSLIIFDGKVPHMTTMPPLEICESNPRYTIATDYNIKRV